MKTLITIIILLCASSLLATDLREMKWEEVPTITVPDVDFEYQKQGLLIVESPIQGLKFKSTNPLRKGWIYQKDDEPGIWYVKVSAGTNIIDISADGFLPLLNIRKVFGVREAWKIRVTPKTPEVNELPVVIRVEPSEADVRIDGNRTDVSGSVKLAIGEHSIEITKSGYVTIKDNFTVNPDNILFEYTLEKPKLCVVEVTTEPSGAEVSIDGVKLNGTTPISDFYDSGRYPIKITLDKYLPVEETLFIDQTKAKNSFTYRLEPNFGSIIIASEPEVNMDIILNGKPVGKTPLTLKNQIAGNYLITSDHEYYTAESINLVLQRNENYRATLQCASTVGDIDISCDPEVNMDIYLNGVFKGKSPLKLNNLTPDEYSIEGKHNYYFADPIQVSLSPGQDFHGTLKPRRTVGDLKIISEPEVGMHIHLNGENQGKTPINLMNLPEGEYRIEGEHELYLADPIKFNLIGDETVTKKLVAQENFATLTINTTPGASVYLNNQKLTNLRDLRLSPQTARLRAEKPKCETVETTLILKRGARETVDLYLDEQTGTIAISVDPPNASIELNGDAGEHFTSTGTKIFENIPVGSYELEVTLKGYKTDKRTLRLRPDETLRERITLEEGGGGEGPMPGMVFVEIPGGSFAIMTTEVTQSMWEEVMGSNPSHFRGGNLPVEKVSWSDCQEFIKKLNQRDVGNNYRLPTESEWESACRAGTSTNYCSGDSDSDLDRVGWYSSNSGNKTHPVGQKEPNSWGLYDMHGNVWEWCQDSAGSGRVLRGGSWDNYARYCRSARRNNLVPSGRGSCLGFRLVRSL